MCYLHLQQLYILCNYVFSKHGILYVIKEAALF